MSLGGGILANFLGLCLADLGDFLGLCLTDLGDFPGLRVPTELNLLRVLFNEFLYNLRGGIFFRGNELLCLLGGVLAIFKVT